MFVRPSGQCRKHFQLQALLALLLSICLITGCAAPAVPSPFADPSAARTASASYEQYDEDSLKVQSDFDTLTEELFRTEGSPVRPFTLSLYPWQIRRPMASLNTPKTLEPFL